ncbi:hypothetical protein ABID29_002427 [Streptococcus rupicaprae]|uniref:Pre-toxin TG domain-containing protein n=1 Tax=Streptococcus rupicaprae TaxID=759619 RepID=A0ABV2FL64_9STRE
MSSPTFTASNPTPETKTVAKPTPKPKAVKVPSSYRPSLPSSWKPKAPERPIVHWKTTPTAQDKAAQKRMEEQFKRHQETLKAVGRFVVNTAGELTGAYDGYRLITGTDPVTGAKTSRLAAAGWLAASVVPGSKLLKGADTAHDVTKAVGTINRTTSTIKASHAAVTAAKATKGARSALGLQKAERLLLTQDEH